MGPFDYNDIEPVVDNDSPAQKSGFLNWLSGENLTGLGNMVGSVISAIKGTPKGTFVYNQGGQVTDTTSDETPQKDNTMLYIGVGVAVVVLISVVVLLIRRAKS